MVRWSLHAPQPCSLILMTLFSSLGHTEGLLLLPRRSREVREQHPHTKPWVPRRGLAGSPKPFLWGWAVVDSAHQNYLEKKANYF